MSLTRGAGVLAVALFAGCVSGPPQIGDRPAQARDAQAESRYQAALEHFSAHQEVYWAFDTEVFAQATYQSRAFRDLRARRQAGFEEQPEDALQRSLAAEQKGFDDSIEFFFGAHVTDRHFDDFDEAKSKWHISLVTTQGQVTPLSVERVGRSDANLRAYYPYLAEFWVGYRIKFPHAFANGQPVLTGGAQELLLQLASPLGKMELKVPAE